MHIKYPNIYFLFVCDRSSICFVRNNRVWKRDSFKKIRHRGRRHTKCLSNCIINVVVGSYPMDYIRMHMCWKRLTQSAPAVQIIFWRGHCETTATNITKSYIPYPSVINNINYVGRACIVECPGRRVHMETKHNQWNHNWFGISMPVSRYALFHPTTAVWVVLCWRQCVCGVCKWHTLHILFNIYGNKHPGYIPDPDLWYW